jgi:hypothetical protein
MPLYFADGESFAVGATSYDYHQATDSDTSPRIFINIGVGGDETSAFVDTGGVYFICTPPFARRIGLDPTQGTPASGRILWRNDWLDGALFRLPLTLPADQGESMTIEVTAFVPQVGPHQDWNDELPCVLGMQFCLERMRFAVDPEHDMFYFGEFGETL